MMNKEEPIACFDNNIITVWGMHPGFVKLDSILDTIGQGLTFIPRALAEKNPSIRQLVPYTVIMSGRFYFVYRRTQKSDEIGLRGKYSIGTSGHINESDERRLERIPQHGINKIRNLILNAAKREIEEEIRISSKNLTEPRFLGFVFDDFTQVSKKHFGVALLARLSSTPNGTGISIDSVEQSIGKPRFWDIYTLKADREKFETWSQILIDHFLERENAVKIDENLGSR
jgi:predicted NUDIX family phosphoesterase